MVVNRTRNQLVESTVERFNEVSIRGLVMIKHKFYKLLRKFNCNPPVNDLMIGEFEQKSGLNLPKDYIDFLRTANGGEGFIGKSAYLILWKLEEIMDINTAYRVHEYAPDIMLIGTDGGDEAFAFDTNACQWPVIQIPFIGMDRELIQIVASDFTSFLEHLYDIE